MSLSWAYLIVDNTFNFTNYQSLYLGELVSITPLQSYTGTDWMTILTVVSKTFVSVHSYAESLASTRILKHSVESSRGSCGENLAWASYDQSGTSFMIIIHTHNTLFISYLKDLVCICILCEGKAELSWDTFLHR